MLTLPEISGLYVNPVAVLFVSSFLLSSCLSSSLSSNEDDEQLSEDLFVTDPVPPDGILETVTWNIEWYGHTSRGPSDEQLQTDNVLRVIDTLRADLYALQEIFSNRALQNITKRMEGYRGFASDFDQNPSFSQQTAFIFNTNTIDSVSSGLITENQNTDDWAGGRFPMFFEFDYSFEDVTIPVFAVVIHAEAFADQESYNSRRGAAESLYNFLTEKKADANIILLGDFNDDVDLSTFNNEETPYHLFAEDTLNYKIATKSLSEKNFSSTVEFNEMIDHIVFSNELFNRHVTGSEKVFTRVTNFIEMYTSTTSDHFPVFTEFVITGE